MARKPSPTLTEGEFRLMQVLWETGEARVGEVAERLPGETRLAYNTVLTTMRILEKKGYLLRQKHGRAHIYRPNISRSQALLQAVRHVVTSFFDNSPEAMMLCLLKDKELSPQDLERLKRMVMEQ